MNNWENLMRHAMMNTIYIGPPPSTPFFFFFFFSIFWLRPTLRLLIIIFNYFFVFGIASTTDHVAHEDLVSFICFLLF